MSLKQKLSVFNVSGPYAVGKDTILNELIGVYGDRIHRVRTLTTRPVSREADPTYEQVTSEEFKKRISSGRWIVNYQLGGTTAYATDVEEIEREVRRSRICILSVYAGPDGAGRLREVFGSSLLSVGLLAASGDAEQQLSILRSRLLGRRRDDPMALEARLQHQLQPIRYVLENPYIKTADFDIRVFDQVCINEDLRKTVSKIMRLFASSFFEQVANESKV